MKKTGFRSYFTVYWVALVISVLSTTILKLFFMDMSTGFIDTNRFFPNQLLTIISRLALIIPIIYWFFQTFRRRARHDFPLSYRHIPTSILGILTGLTMILYCVKIVPEQILTPQSGVFSNKLVLMLNFVLGILGGISMIIGAIQPQYGRYGKPGVMLGFCPALWQLIVLLSRFKNFIAVTTINDIILNILFMCFAAAFLMGQSRIVYGLGTRDGRSYSIPTGLSVSLVGLTFALPNLILFIKQGGIAAPLKMTIPEFLYVLVLSLYSLVFLSGYSRSIYRV